MLPPALVSKSDYSPISVGADRTGRPSSPFRAAAW
jgi:hypothetical protein